MARVAAGGWFSATGVTMGLQYRDLVPQAARLWARDVGATDAPIRSLLALIMAPVLVVLGLTLIWKGIGWMRRVEFPAAAPSAIEADEVIATLKDHELFAFRDGPTKLYWPVRRWLADELMDMTWWRRELLSRGVQAFVRSCGVAFVIAAICLALPYFLASDLLGPFPLGFIFLFPVVAAIWAALSLMLISSGGPRIESVEFPLPARAGSNQGHRPARIMESPPTTLPSEPPGLALTLGICGIAVQCLLLVWWNLSQVGYPLLATSIIRHGSSIAGGIVFFVLGNRMALAAAELLQRFRYESMLVLIEDSGHGMVARAATVRSESRGALDPRHVLSAVGGINVRESAEAFVASALSVPSPHART